MNKPKKWKTVSDMDVRHVWKGACGCHPGKKDVVRLSPAWYEENGTPICSECGDDMEYVKTEIK